MNYWDNVFNVNIRTYVQIISAWLTSDMKWEEIDVEASLIKNNFIIKESVLQKDYKKVGLYPIVSQSKDLISGYSDEKELLMDQDIPTIIFGDHTQVVKYIDFPFIIGADGVKILKPLDEYIPKFFYYLIKSIDLKSSKYARHYKNLRSQKIPYKDKSFIIQEKIVSFLDDLQSNSLRNVIYFDDQIESKILQLHQFLLNINYVIHENEKQSNIISQLKQAILQEAISGQLTAEWRKQNPIQKGNPDTDAAALLAKIKAEKQQLIADGKLKQEKKQDSISESSLLIPNTWENPLLGDITKQITDGTHQTPNYVSNGKTFLSAQNVKPFRFIPENHRYITEQAFLDYRKNRTPKKGDLLIARVGAGIGETAVIDQNIEFAFYVSLALVKVFKEFTNPDYLAVVCNSPYGVQYAKGNVSSNGVSAGNYNLGRIRSFKIPLPPLAEQKAIVEKVDYLMKIIDQLDAQIKHRKQLAEDLMQTVLREAFE